MGAPVGLDKDEAIGRVCQRTGKGGVQIFPGADPLAYAQVLFTVRTQHEMLFGKACLFGERFNRSPLRRQQVGKICLALQTTAKDHAAQSHEPGH